MDLFRIPFNDKNDGQELVQDIMEAEGTGPTNVSKGTIGGCPQGELSFFPPESAAQVGRGEP